MYLHYVFNTIFFFRISCRLLDNVEKHYRVGQAKEDITAHVLACWITKATNTNSEYVILIAFPLQQYLHESVSIFCYTYILSLVSDWNDFHIMRGTKCVLKCVIWGKAKGQTVPLQAWSVPESSRKLRSPNFMTTTQDDGKFVSLRHRPPLPPGNAPGTYFC